jgi:protease secretion system membrane fusion protein
MQHKVSEGMQEQPVVPVPDLRRTSRWGLWIIAVAIIGFVVWAVTAPLDEGVPTQGNVAIDTKRVTVQHLQGGIIREVMVREGQIVHQGDLLIRLDDALTRANYEAIRQRYLGLRALEARLLAEQQELEEIEFHPDLISAAADPNVLRHMDNQSRLLVTRRRALQAELQAIEESIRSQEGTIETMHSIIGSRREQQAIVREELDNISDLVVEGFIPRNRLLELNRQLSEVVAAITELQGNIMRAQQAILEQRQRALARSAEVRREVETQIADVAREVEADEARYRAIRDELVRTEIRASATGQVVGLAFQSPGGVIPPGQRILDIVPESQDLLLETQILPHLIDSVRPGLSVDIRLSVFPTEPMLVVEGEVVTVSGDLLSDPVTGMGYFLARVRVTEAGRATLGNRSLQPGMPAEVIVRTGQRTLLTYLMHPLTRRIASSMTEQ